MKMVKLFCPSSNRHFKLKMTNAYYKGTFWSNNFGFEDFYSKSKIYPIWRVGKNWSGKGYFSLLGNIL